MEQTAREKVLQRILNLRAKAENEASSEAEMNTAFLMAVKLMDSYEVEEAELALAETQGKIKLEIITKDADTTIFKGNFKHSHNQKHHVIKTLSAIAKFTCSRVVFNSYSGSITFTGHRPDVELANYLVAVIRSALDNEYDVYRKATPGVGYGAKTSFQTAMAYRINSRLNNMANDREQEIYRNKKEALKIEHASIASSTALIIAEVNQQKKIEVEAKFAKQYPKLRNVNLSSRVTNGTAHGAGYKAGDRVNLGRAISAGSTKQIA